MLGYPLAWQRMVSEWRSTGPGDRAWLLYAASYLFRTGGVRWALDPLTLRRRLPEAPGVDVSADLAGLSFVLLSHEHSDHFDLELIRQLRGLPITWVVPEFLLDRLRPACLPAERVLVAQPLRPLVFSGIRITPFPGQHWEADPGYPGGRRGVPATGYLVEWPGRRWLFPGDIRTYDPAGLPDFGPLDGAFAHLWLGRHGAGADTPPLLEAFCRYFLAVPAARLVVTHLEEYSRPPESRWVERHYHMVQDWFSVHEPQRQLCLRQMGQAVDL